MAEVDTLRRFVFERYPFRGQLVHLGPAWKAMMEHHDYPGQVRDTLGEAVAAAALLASTLKFHGLLTLQLRGGPESGPDIGPDTGPDTARKDGPSTRWRNRHEGCPQEDCTTG